MLRDSVESDTGQRRLWFTAGFSVVAFVAAFAACLALGHPKVGLAAGLVAMFAAVGAGVAPRGMTLQIGIPAGVAVLATIPLVLAADRRPWVAAAVTAVVMVLGSLTQADAPVGTVVGFMGSTAYVMGVASRSIHDVSAGEAALAVAVGGTAAAAAVAGLMAWRAYGAHEGISWVPPKVPRVPGNGWVRWWRAVTTALRDWRHDPYVRLAVRRLVVLPPMVAGLVAWGNDDALFGLLAAFAVTQPTLHDTEDRTVAQITGTLLACAGGVAAGLLLPTWAVIPLGILGIAFGLAFIRRNQVIAAAGTTAFALAGAGLYEPLETLAPLRLAAAVAGVAIAVLATLVIRPPRRRQPVAASEPEGGTTS